MRIRTIEIGDDVAEVLRGATWPSKTLLALPAGQLDRKLYERVAKVLAALGGKWKRAAAGFEFPGPAAAELSAAIEGGRLVDRKRTLELFETPPALAERVTAAALAGLGSNFARPRRVLEPSAGTGRLLAAWAPGGVCSDWVVAIDVDARNCEALREQGIATAVVMGDFLGMTPASPHSIDVGEPRHRADVILMNPPFGNTADILHVCHAFRSWLAPGGVLVAIMSAHFTFASDAPSRGFRDMIDPFTNPDVRSSLTETLPDGAFRESGTGVRSVMLTLQKVAG